MTSGSIVRDQRVSYSNPYGTVLAGTYFSKTWSGIDNPPRVKIPKQPPEFYYIEQTRYRWVRHGKLRWKQPYTVRVLRFRKSSNPRPPRRAGGLVPHDYEAFITKSNDPVVTAVQRGPDDPLSYPSWVRGENDYQVNSAWMGCGLALNDLGSQQNLELKALDKLRDKVAGSDFNFGVFMAEAKPALNMIFDAATRVDKAYRHARRGNFLAAARDLVDGRQSIRPFTARKSLAENWLALQYGWLPLLKDAEAGAEFLAHMTSVPLQQRVAVRATIRGQKNTCAGFPNFEFSEWGDVMSIQLIAYLREMDTVGLSGLTDPYSVVWERMPFSFVADWFVPIGSYLQNRALARSLVGTFVKTVSRRTSGAGIRQKYEPKQFGYYYPLQGSFSRVQITRTVSQSLNVPLPQWKGLDRAASWMHTANAVGLVVSMHGSGGSRR